jgi:hypothetical protein
MTRDRSHVPLTEAGLGRRKEPRVTANRAGWIALKMGSPLQVCFVWNVSDHGVKLTVDNAADLPDTFYLYLSTHFHSRHHCRVMWRSGNQVGVELLSHLPDKGKGEA